MNQSWWSMGGILIILLVAPTITYNQLQYRSRRTQLIGILFDDLAYKLGNEMEIGIELERGCHV